MEKKAIKRDDSIKSDQSDLLVEMHKCDGDPKIY